MPKVILLSQVQLPYHKTGSWTTLYKNYLVDDHQIDIIICEQPNYYFQDIQYETFKPDFWFKVYRRITKDRFHQYIKALESVIKIGEKYVLQIVDNFGLASALLKHLHKKNIRSVCYIQFFYHGYPPMLNKESGNLFFEGIDEMILLTNASYKQHCLFYSSLACRISILYNGIDTSKFFPVSDMDKEKLKLKFNLERKKVFVWCSQDRPKKGLSLLLDVWIRIWRKHSNIALIVIGASQKRPIPGVRYMGEISNDLLPEYYQLADVYLFPTLCQEGFSLSLTEALHCGCHCIASSLGGVPEILQHGKLGQLIDNPHFLGEWERAIGDYLTGKAPTYNFPKDLYTSKQWNKGMNRLIENSKLNLV